MQKRIFIFLIIINSVFANNISTITVSKENWINLNKEAIAKLIINQRKLNNRIKKLEILLHNKNKYIVKTYEANVRIKPNIKSKVVGCYPKGQIVYITNFVGIWGKIKKNMYISKYVLQRYDERN